MDEYDDFFKVPEEGEISPYEQGKIEALTKFIMSGLDCRSVDSFALSMTVLANVMAYLIGGHIKDEKLRQFIVSFGVGVHKSIKLNKRRLKDVDSE